MAAAPWRMRPAPVGGDRPHEVVDQFGGPPMQYPNEIGDVGHRHLEKLSIIFNAGSPALGKIRHMNVLGLVGAPRAMIYA